MLSNLTENQFLIAGLAIIIAVSLLAFMVGVFILLQRIKGLQRLQSNNFKNMINACRYLIEMNKKMEVIEKQASPDEKKFEANRMFRNDSAYQYAIQLFESGRTIDEVVDSCQLSWGEAELIQSLHGK